MSHYHFLGLGGVGMSALARLLKQKKKKVTGQDDNPSSFIQTLQKEGIELCFEIPKQDSVIVYSSACKNHPALLKAKQRNLSIIHRSQLLSELMQDHTCILVAGTHGKTSTSALLSHVLFQANQDPSFAVGGILKNYETNANSGTGPYFIAEADESDGSFLSHPSEIAILTNLEEEHLDYWKNKKGLIQGFQQFINRTKTLFWCKEDKNLQKICPKQISYGFSVDCDVRAEKIYSDSGGSFFDIWDQGHRFERVYIPLFGSHNILNALAVFALCNSLQIPEKLIRKGFETFLGVQKRLEQKSSIGGVDIYFDYAHHPTEIACTLQALKDKVKERKITCVFQPHRYSRVQRLINFFQFCFTNCDELIMTQIYSAGEQKKELIEEQLFDRIDHVKKDRIETKDLIGHLMQSTRPHDVIVFMGAGDIHDIGESFHTLYSRDPNKLKVGVFYGGVSNEHEVSVLSAQFFFKYLNREIYEVQDLFLSKEGKIENSILEKTKKLDIAIPVLHGRKGEDGAVQGFLEMLDIAYVGCSYASSSICMDKAWTKLIAIREQIPTASFYEICLPAWQVKRSEILKRCKEFHSYPLYVKGSHMGSSLGIKRIENKQEIEQTIDEIFQMDDALILEEEVKGRQIEFSLWGNDHIQVGVPLEVDSRSFYSYEKKYEQISTRLPAKISKQSAERGKELAKRMYRAAKCSGLARIDFFLTDEGKYLFNEINPMPGFTPMSAYFPMVKAKNISECAFVDQLIILGLQRKRRCRAKI